MKFLSELSSCYRPPPEKTSDDDRCGHSTAASCSNQAVRGRTSGASGGYRASHWQPNLSAISEDGVVSSEEKWRRDEAVRRGQVKKSPSIRGGSAVKSGDFSRSQSCDRQRGNAMQVVVPVFSPTPFAF